VKKILQNIVNTINLEEIELLFGKESKIVVNSILYSTNNKTYVIDVTIFVSDIENSVEAFPDSLDLFLQKSWEFILYGKKPIIISKMDILENFIY
jgi:hypothetical protein